MGPAARACFVVVAAASFLGANGCGGDASCPLGAEGAGCSPAADAGAPEPTADELFSLARVTRLDLGVSDADLDHLRDEPRTYVPATLLIDGHEVDQVGVRLRGSFSYQDLGGKPAFKISFDEYVPHRQMAGLESLTLTNLRQDHTQLHEWLAYQVFRAAGAPAPRTGFAELWLDGEAYGLYALVETVDDSFLAARFSDPTGNLYEGTLGDDLRDEDLWELEQDEGSDDSRADLQALIDVAERPGDDVFYGDGTRVDVDAFVALVASEGVTGHWDGYWRSHNYRIYHEPTADLWYVIPWGADQTLDRHLAPFDSQGLLARKCFASARCLAAYAEAARGVLATFSELDLESSMDAAIALTADATAADTRQPFSPEVIAWHRDELRAYLRGRVQEWAGPVACTAGGAETDRDDDGFGDCIHDCEPDAAAAHPGGTEVCDGLDDDCNGRVDELAECACPTAAVQGATFSLCDRAYTPPQARTACAAMGLGLAWIDDETQGAALFARTQALRPGDWIIGIDDLADEGEQVWTGGPEAGEAPGFDGWAPGEPDDWGGQDCAAMAAAAGGRWIDLRCGDRLPFVCR